MTATTGGGIAGGTTTATTPASALALALTLALAPTAVAMMAIAHCPFHQEVEDHGAEPCVVTTTGGGITDGMTLTMTTVPSSASASAPTAAATMAIARHLFNQEVENCGAKPCVTPMTGGGITDRTMSTAMTAPALASASTSAQTAAATMASACCPFAQEVEDCGAEPHVTTTSRVSWDKYQ